jgi:general secretion pathway protein K
MKPATRARQHERGLALVAVMWMVAALAILVASLGTATRSEIHVAQTTRGVVEAAALGDAAIQLAMLELGSLPTPVRGLHTRIYTFEGRDITVELVPVAGLIDINFAPHSLLLALLLYGAQLDEKTAEALAERIIEWRTFEHTLDDPAYEAAGVRFRPRHGLFEYPEDLLQVLGVSYDVYHMIRRFITVYGDSAGIDPMAAPLGVLAVLARGDVALAQQIAAVRDAGDPVSDLTGLVQEHLGTSVSLTYRLDARVESGGRVYLRTRWVDLGQPGTDGSEWRTLRIEPVVGAAAQTVMDHGI